jgi:hypothetical protein
MTSYIQLLNKIEAFCNAHYQIQRYGGEFREQMPNLSTESEKYPIVFVSPTGGVPMYDTNQISLDIYCVDVIQKDRANLNTIVSDCHLILTDLYGYFSQGTDLDVDVVAQPLQTPLNNLDLDYVAGWMMTIVFEVNGYCVNAIPMGTIPSGGGTCEDADYTITDSDGTTLYSGTIASGGSLTQVIGDSSAVLRDTSGDVISTTAILAEGSANITAPNGTVTITDDSANVLHTVSVESNGTASQIISDSTVQNSDASYTGSVNAQGSLTLPDSQINVNGVDQGDVVSVKTIDVNVTDGTNPVTPDAVSLVGNTLTIEVPAGSPPAAGATLTKTGCVTSIVSGDDGDLQIGRAVSFSTLNYTNPFGNTNRFTDELGGSTYTNNIVIDWSTYDNVAGTVLGIYRTNLSTVVGVTFANAIANSAALSVGSFTSGWRLWNRNEAVNFMNANSFAYNYSPLNATTTNYTYWTSTPYPLAANNAYLTTNIGQVTITSTLGASGGAVAVRTFTVSGTTLS